MKTILYISIFTLLLLSCDKDKSDARKMVGTWKRSLHDAWIDSTINVDTVYINKDKFKSNNSTGSYYLSNGNMYVIYNNSDTVIYCYSLESKNSFRLGCWYLNGKEFRLTKIN